MLSEKQISTLRDLALREERLSSMAEGLLASRESDLVRIDDLQRRIQLCRHNREKFRTRRDVVEQIARELVDLEQELERRKAANDRRYSEVGQYRAAAHAITTAIDGVLAHAGSSRRALGLDFYRGDETAHRISYWNVANDRDRPTARRARSHPRAARRRRDAHRRD